MQVVELLTQSVQVPEWNANVMDDAMRGRLEEAIQRFGLVVPLVVRELGEGWYETIGGAQRLAVLQELGLPTVPCVVVHADDVEARLLSQCLNRIAGSDDLGLKGELLHKVLEVLPQTEVMQLLPETTESLQALASLGQQDLASYVQNWQQSQAARLKHLTFQSTPAQLEVIEEALARVMPQVSKNGGENPNPRGNALYLLCKAYLELTGRDS